MRNTIEEEILLNVRPADKEQREVQEMGQKLIDAVIRIAGVPAMMTGSVARGTWVRGDKDIDIFMLFPKTLSREELQEKGLAAAYAVVEMFKGSSEEKYAEHPYLNAVIEGFDVDLVPCYHIDSTAEMQCAVDRTPFHTRYLLDRIGGLRDDVLLLKQFTKGGGVYGSDHMTGGFSGYLCELLILAYGGFTELLQAASTFRYGEVIDIERFYPDKKTVRKLFSEPLIVIDPTDKTRNVAAALTPTRFSEFVELARDYCTKPDQCYFIPDAPTSISKEEFRSVLETRGTTMLALSFKTPAYVPDTVVPQLRKTMESIRNQLETEDFPVHRAEVMMGTDNCLIIFELLVADLPKITLRNGPPVWVHDNADRFVEKYLIGNPFAGPWISEDRYYTEVDRRYPHAYDLLADQQKILSGSIGKHVRISMEEGYSIRKNEEIWSPEFTFFLSAYFAKSSHAVRKLRIIDQK